MYLLLVVVRARTCPHVDLDILVPSHALCHVAALLRRVHLLISVAATGHSAPGAAVSSACVDGKVGAVAAVVTAPTSTPSAPSLP